MTESTESYSSEDIEEVLEGRNGASEGLEEEGDAARSTSKSAVVKRALHQFFFGLPKNAAFMDRHDITDPYDSDEGMQERKRLIKKQPIVRKAIQHSPHETVLIFLKHADDLLDASIPKQIILSITGGMLICFGAILSIFLSTGVTESGPARLLLGLGFVGGFTMVILSGSALFTEINVMLPDMLMVQLRQWSKLCLRCLRFWLICYIGNIIGSLLLSAAVNQIAIFGEEEKLRLIALVDSKMKYAGKGASGWFQALLSAVMGNMLVGLAAFFSSAARTVYGKISAIFFPVMAFVALGVQHAPANMGYLFLDLTSSDPSVGWWSAFSFNLIPASIGNLIGGSTVTLLLFWYVFGPQGKDLSNMYISAYQKKRGKKAKWFIDHSKSIAKSVRMKHFHKKSAPEKAVDV